MVQKLSPTFEKVGQIQGFPLGGGDNLRRGHFSAKMYAKTTELDLMGGARRWFPGSANVKLSSFVVCRASY